MRIKEPVLLARVACAACGFVSGASRLRIQHPARQSKLDLDSDLSRISSARIHKLSIRITTLYSVQFRQGHGLTSSGKKADTS